MTEPITNIDGAYEFFYDSGLSITMRLKKGDYAWNEAEWRAGKDEDLDPWQPSK